MEEENLCFVEAEHHPLQDQQCINGGQVFSTVWGETDVQMNQAEETNEVCLSPKTGRKSPEEADQCEETLWAPQHISCPSLPVATVKWDELDSSAESLLVNTDNSSLANELDLASLNCTSPTNQPQDVTDEPEDKEEQDDGGRPNLESSGNDSEPCDAADVKEEDSTRQQLESKEEILLSTGLEEEGEHTVTSTAVETEDILDPEHTSMVLKPEEEEELSVLLTEREDSEEEQSPANSAENKEESEVGEQSLTNSFSEGETLVKDVNVEEENEDETQREGHQSVTNVHSEEEEPVRDLEVPAELLHTDNAGSSSDPLIDLQEPEPLEDSGDTEAEKDTEWINEDLKVQKLELCEDADQNVESRQFVTNDNNEDAPINEAENAEEIKNSPERVEGIENQQEERQERDQTASQDGPHPEMAEKPEEDPDQSGETQDLDQSSKPSEQTVCIVAEILEPEVTQQDEENTNQVKTSDQAEDVNRVVINGAEHKAKETVYRNGDNVDREKARALAERLFKLDDIERADVVKHLDKDNDFSRAVGEEYLKFFNFTDQTLDQALRSFLKVVLLIGETQERERVLQHFSNRFHECNPNSYSSPGAVLTLTCALMLLNTDLHGQHVGKSMSSSKFVSNLDAMNEGGNFNKDLLKSLYNSIKSDPLEWAVDEKELKNLVDDAEDGASLRSKANPFQDVPHDKEASVVKDGFLVRKLHADVNGKRTPWGKRGWKNFFGELKGMVLYLKKNNIHGESMTTEEVVSMHHSLAEQAADYTKKPHVFRLQTADWRVFLFKAQSTLEMNSWINRINLVSALYSSPPFPAAVGSQRRFFRPILPASQSDHPLEHQLQSQKKMLESFRTDLLDHKKNLPDVKKTKTRDLEEHRVRTEYLQHEVCRYGIYIQMLEIWKKVKKTDKRSLKIEDLELFDKAANAQFGVDDEEEGLKRSYSSPSLELETGPPLIKVKRNISERRTYRRTIVPRLNKEA